MSSKITRTKEAFWDILKAFAAGLAAAVILTLILFGLGVLLGKNGIPSGLETAKNGMLILAAAGMFLIAGMLLIKGKKPEKPITNEKWRARFRVIGFKSLIGALCAAFLLAAQCLDILLLTRYTLV